jgi:phosphotransferase system enzyme I (PtsI)
MPFEAPPPRKPAKSAKPATKAPATAIRPETVLRGIPISAGIAIGTIASAHEKPVEITRRKIAAADSQAEIARFEAAIAQSLGQLERLRLRLSLLPEESRAEIEPLLDAYRLVLGPSRLVRNIRARIADRLTAAESAVASEAEALAALLLAAHGEGAEELAAAARRAEEVREIGRRIIRNLTNVGFRNFANLPPGAVLVTDSLRPAEAAQLDPARIGGVAADEGGAGGHTAVIVRALGLPCVLGVAGLSAAAIPGDWAIVDGTTGTVTLNPAPHTLERARQGQRAFAKKQQRFAQLRRLPAATRDGVAVALQANLELPLELRQVSQSGAHGIGLLRTEFLFMNQETVPGEDAQTSLYRGIIEAMNGDPVAIRVLDWGDEKGIDSLQNAGLAPDIVDVNPALGMRGIRFLLRRPALFETQLAAILRASVAGDVRIILPMVTNLAEVRAARAIYTRTATALRRRGERIPEKVPPLGVMIETPAAALSAEVLAAEADFFALGTNDLTAYTLAADRGDSDVAGLYDPLHPSVLRLIRLAADAAAKMQIPLSICGEMAAKPLITPLLLGMGLRSFSVSSSAVPLVKRAIRSVTIAECVTLALAVTKLNESSEVAEALEQFHRQKPSKW